MTKKILLVLFQKDFDMLVHRIFQGLKFSIQSNANDAQVEYPQQQASVKKGISGLPFCRRVGSKKVAYANWSRVTGFIMGGYFFDCSCEARAKGDSHAKAQRRKALTLQMDGFFFILRVLGS